MRIRTRTSTHVTEADILNQSRIQLRSRHNLLHERVDHVVEIRVLETALAGLGERRAQRKRDDHIVGVLLGSAFEETSARICNEYVSEEPVHSCNSAAGVSATQVVHDRAEPRRSHTVGLVLSLVQEQNQRALSVT